VVTENVNVLDLIGKKLREEWKHVLEMPLPGRLQDLVAQLDRVGARLSSEGTPGDCDREQPAKVAFAPESGKGTEEREVGPPLPKQNPK
jgi:hypothetical protein